MLHNFSQMLLRYHNTWGFSVYFQHSVLVAMVNIGTVDIIGTVFWWPWSTLAQWSSLAECYGGCDQHWHSGHHWCSVLVNMDNIGTVDIIGTVFWWPWTTLAKWSSLAQCFGGPGQHWHSVLVVMVNIGTMVIIGTVFWWSWSTLTQWSSLAQCFGCHGHHWHSVWWPWSTLAQWSSLAQWSTLAQWTSLAQCFGGHGQHWHSGSEEQNIGAFCGDCLYKLFNNQFSCIQWHFYIGGLLPGDSSQFQPESEFHFRYLEKSVEQTIDLVQIYNESCVMKGTWKITNERYGSLMFSLFTCTSS